MTLLVPNKRGKRKWVIHKPCGEFRGEGVNQMTILLHKPYIVKVATMGEGESKKSKKLPRDLWITPYEYVLQMIGFTAIMRNSS